MLEVRYCVWYSFTTICSEHVCSVPYIELLFKAWLAYIPVQVLSHRGRLWVLLQNVCRDMYSSLSNLSNLLVNCPTLSASSEILIGCLYSHSARTLYLGSRALIDMVETLDGKGLDLVKQVQWVHCTIVDALSVVWR